MAGIAPVVTDPEMEKLYVVMAGVMVMKLMKHVQVIVMHLVNVMMAI